MGNRRVAWAVVLCLWLLAACRSQSDSTGHVPTEVRVLVSESRAATYSYQMFEVRGVTCIGYKMSSGTALSCDWSRYEGGE